MPGYRHELFSLTIPTCLFKCICIRAFSIKYSLYWIGAWVLGSHPAKTSWASWDHSFHLLSAYAVIQFHSCKLMIIIFYFWREFSPIVCFFWGPSPDGPTSTHGTGCQVKQLLRIRQHWLRYIKFVFIFCDNHLSTAGNRTWDFCFTVNRLQTHAVATMW